MSGFKTWRFKKLASLLLVAVLIPTLSPSPVEAFWVHNAATPSYGYLEYEIDASVAALGPDGWRAIHAADQTWTPNWQWDRFRIFDGADRRNLISAVDFGGPASQSGTIAFVNQVGCTPGNCSMTINTEYMFDVNGDATVAPNTYDLWTVVAHEMGHWIGVHHANGGLPGTWTNPSTDNRDPIMQPGVIPNVKRRDIKQDDSNGFWAARPDWHWNGVVANPSFDTDASFYGWISRGYGRPVCSAGYGWHGDCVHKLSGAAGSSTYQDLEPRGNPFPNGRLWSLGFRVRTAQTQTVTVALWSLNHGQSLNTTCTITGNSQWQFCQLGPVVPYGNDTRFRLEIYKNGTADIDLDVPIFG